MNYALPLSAVWLAWWPIAQAHGRPSVLARQVEPSSSAALRSPDESSTRAVDELRALLSGAQEAQRSGDHGAARAQISAAIERALSELGASEDPDAMKLVESMADFARDIGELASGEKAARLLLDVRSRTLHADHGDLQAARHALGSILVAATKYQEARALYEEMLETCARTLPDDHVYVVWVRGQLARALVGLEDLQAARALQESVLDAESRTQPDDEYRLQVARLNLAYTIRELGELDRARELEEKVLDVFSRTLADDHNSLQVARTNLALTSKRLRDYDRARVLEEKVLEVYARTLPHQHPLHRGARGNLALTLGYLGHHDAARRIQEPDLEALSRTVPDDHPTLHAPRLNLSITLTALGELHRARTLLERVLEIRLRTLPDDHPRVLLTRLNLAITLHRLGDRQAARALFESLLEVHSRTLSDDHPDVQDARHNLAACLYIDGEIADAKTLLEKVLEGRARSLPDDNLKLQQTRTMLGETMRQLGDLQGSRVLQEKVHEVYSRTRSYDDPQLQAARHHLGATLHDLGDERGARELFEKVFDVRTRTLPEDHADLALARETLVWVLVEGLAASPDREESGEDRIESRKRIAGLIADSCKAQTAAARSAVFSASTREASERCAQISQGLSTAFSVIGGVGGMDPFPELDEACFLLSETARGGAIRAASLMRLDASSPRQAELRAELATQREQLARLVRQGATSQTFRDALARRDNVERKLVELARESSAGNAAAFDLGVESLTRSLGDRDAIVAYRRYRRTSLDLPRSDTSNPPVKTALRSEQVDSLCAFVLRREAREGKSDATAKLSRFDLGPIEPIERAIHEWREGLGAVGGRGVAAGAQPRAADLGERGSIIRNLVLDPLSAELIGVERIVFVLDDVLHLAPFDALPRDGAADELLGDRVRIETRATLGELLGDMPRPSGLEGLLAVGDVAFDVEDSTPRTAVPGLLRGGEFGGFQPLPATGDEIDALAQSFEAQLGSSGKTSILRGADASRERFLELAPEARWLHVATHGWFAPESIRSWQDQEPLDAHMKVGVRLAGDDQVKNMSPMLLCGIALSGANAPEDGVGRAPGLLTAEEIAALDLAGCELAVLSACDTNLGERKAGQGVASLQHALQMAGARSVITSLWKVPDRATKELMLDFYRRLWVEKKPKWQALWEAKQRMRDAKDERGEPKYTTRDWAAWVLTGDPD